MNKKKIIFNLEIFKEKDSHWKYQYDIDTEGDSELADNLYICYLLEILHHEILEKDVRKFTKEGFGDGGRVD